jgi:hypothetical protein
MNQYINSYHNYKESQIIQYIQDLNDYIYLKNNKLYGLFT